MPRRAFAKSMKKLVKINRHPMPLTDFFQKKRFDHITVAKYAHELELKYKPFIENPKLNKNHKELKKFYQENRKDN